MKKLKYYLVTAVKAENIRLVFSTTGNKINNYTINNIVGPQ